MKWFKHPIENPSRLREIYVILEQREVDRRTKTAKRSLNHPYTAQVAHLAINRLKNRYFDIYPYDSNRLVLVNPIHDNDYLNASWITEPDFGFPSHLLNDSIKSPLAKTQTWIASQGPLPETRYEFLSLCLASNPSKRPQVIIQLTACQEGGREKSAPYIPTEVGSSIDLHPHCSTQIGLNSRGHEKIRWCSPDPTEKLVLGHIRVTLKSSDDGPSLQTRDSDQPSPSFYRQNTLLLELHGRAQSSRTDENENLLISKATVIHYECINWQDRAVPGAIEPVLELIESAKSNSIIQSPSNNPSSCSPIIVHCSAGVGRTGTLIAIASCAARLNMIAAASPGSRKSEILSYLEPHRQIHEAGRMTQLPSDLDSDLVAHTIDFLREQRVSMVQTEGQVGFVYKAVAFVFTSLLENKLFIGGCISYTRPGM